MKRTLLISVALVMLAATHAAAQRRLIDPNDFVYLGYHDVSLSGGDSAWSVGLTHRRLPNGELRFLQIQGGGNNPMNGWAAEFSIVGKAFGSSVTTITRRWNVQAVGSIAANGEHRGVVFDQTTNRLLVTTGPGYTTVFYPARVTSMTLNDDGTVSNVAETTLDAAAGVPGKRMHGSCNAVPAQWVQAFPQFAGVAYTCGDGGYTSLMLAGGTSTLGKTLYGLPHLNGGVIASADVRKIIEIAAPDVRRGLRVTIPQNYYDAGLGLSAPPTGPPPATARWLSPNAQGLGWQVWGDSYHSTGMNIETPDRYGHVAILSGCGGRCWYMGSTLNQDFRQYEIHVFDPATMTATQRATAMKQITIPGQSGAGAGGSGPYKNISGATFVTETSATSLYAGTMYVMTCWLDTTSGCRMAAWGLLKGASTPTPPPAPQETCNADGTGNGVDEDMDGQTDETCKAPAPPPPANVLPTVAISSPAADAVLPPLVNLAVCAAAADPDGTIKQVEFFSATPFGSDSAGVATAAPYCVTWRPAVVGAYRLWAVATDNAAGTTRSADVAVTSAAPAPPPPAPPTPPAPQLPPPPTAILRVTACSVNLTATAADRPDTTSGWRAQFRVDGVNVGTYDATAPFGPRSKSLKPGNHTIDIVWSKASTAVPTVTSRLGTISCP